MNYISLNNWVDETGTSKSKHLATKENRRGNYVTKAACVGWSNKTYAILAVRLTEKRSRLNIYQQTL